MADTKRILIADDDAVTRQILQSALSEWGYEVVACSNGVTALEALLAPDAPQLAILDWIMPDINGPEICARVREEGTVPHPLMLMLTIKSGTGNLVEGMSSGADDFLIKPIALQELRARVESAWRKVESSERLLEMQRKLESLATRDDLTGAWNRRGIADILRGEVSRAARGGTPIAVAMLDIDYFKKINDQYGHQVGDEVLIELVRRVDNLIRDYDDVARYGGEEFLIVFPGCGVPSARSLCERVRRCVAESPFDTSTGPLAISASIGVAVRTNQLQDTGQPVAQTESITEFIARADAALYQAKREGRNRVVMSETPQNT